MIDYFNQKEKRQDAQVEAMLRRIIPGAPARIEHIDHPALHALGMDLANAMIAPAKEGAIATLFRSAAIPVRTKPFDQVTRNPGTWVLFVDRAFGQGSLDSLWCCCLVEDAGHWFSEVAKLSPQDGTSLVKHHKGMHLLAISGGTLKSILK
jgi:hypothetical protein